VDWWAGGLVGWRIIMDWRIDGPWIYGRGGVVHMSVERLDGQTHTMVEEWRKTRGLPGYGYMDGGLDGQWVPVKYRKLPKSRIYQVKFTTAILGIYQ